MFNQMWVDIGRGEDKYNIGNFISKYKFCVVRPTSKIQKHSSYANTCLLREKMSKIEKQIRHLTLIHDKRNQVISVLYNFKTCFGEMRGIFMWYWILHMCKITKK